MDDEFKDFMGDDNIPSFGGDTSQFGDGASQFSQEGLFSDSGTPDEPSFDTGGNGGDFGTPEEVNDNNIDSKKVAILTTVGGVILLIIAFFLASHFGGSSDDTSKKVEENTGNQQVTAQNSGESRVNTNQTRTNTVQTNNTQNVQSETGESAQLWDTENNSSTYNDNSTQERQRNTATNESSNVNRSGFTEIEVDTLTNISEPISGYLTVTDIKTYARLEENGFGNYFKSIVYGNLTGMTGVYELTIPIGSVGKIQVGDVIDVTYTTADIGGTKFVVDIR